MWGHDEAMFLKLSKCPRYRLSVRVRAEADVSQCAVSQLNVSKPHTHSLNTKMCVVNISVKYPWRDYYAKKLMVPVTKYTAPPW